MVRSRAQLFLRAEQHGRQEAIVVKAPDAMAAGRLELISILKGPDEFQVASGADAQNIVSRWFAP